MNHFNTKNIKLIIPLVIVITIIMLIFLEIAYRFKVYFARRNYVVYSDSFYEFDREFGYRYIPDSNVSAVRILDGFPVTSWNAVVNKNGNIGNKTSTANWNTAELKILAFGDSLTANPNYGGITWTDYLPEELEDQINKKISIINFGRDGYGLLQMFHLASAMIEEKKPDLIIIAFIMNNLTRARFWRTFNMVKGEKRVFTCIQSTRKANIEKSVDTIMINPIISEEWITSIMTNPNKDDFILKKLNEQFDRRHKDYIMPYLYSFTSSLLFNRIVFRDTFHTLKGLPRNPQIHFKSYDEDPIFVKDIETLKSYNIPVFFILLPRRNEMKAGHYILTSHQEFLLDSLQQYAQILSNNSVINLIDYIRELDNVDKLFLLPYDGHPSALGTQEYAKAIAKALTDPQINHNLYEAEYDFN